MNLNHHTVEVSVFGDLNCRHSHFVISSMVSKSNDNDAIIGNSLRILKFCHTYNRKYKTLILQRQWYHPKGIGVINGVVQSNNSRFDFLVIFSADNWF